MPKLATQIALLGHNAHYINAATAVIHPSLRMGHLAFVRELVVASEMCPLAEKPSRQCRWGNVADVDISSGYRSSTRARPLSPPVRYRFLFKHPRSRHSFCIVSRCPHSKKRECAWYRSPCLPYLASHTGPHKACQISPTTLAIYTRISNQGCQLYLAMDMMPRYKHCISCATLRNLYCNVSALDKPDRSPISTR